MQKSIRFLMASLFLMALPITAAFSQGSTTARVTGSVISEGAPLPGAAVVAVHNPTGTQYVAVSNAEGRYNIYNMNVGGPYTITVSFIGYEPQEVKNIYLTLGQTLALNFDLKESATELEVVEIISNDSDIFDGNRTGSETNISVEAINTIPTVERGLNDYMRLTPQANVSNAGATNNGAISFAGVNNRFNSIFIDGAVNNDVFGLANSGTNGGQAGISPISPDALEQIQVVLAPYDVTLGGFAGGGINAVTRSGSNKFEGSAYYFVRNEGLSGKTPTDVPGAERTKLPDFSVKTYGARLGGPIIKNKLFFFANVELQRNEEPRPFVPENYDGNATVADLENLRQYVIDTYDYDPGGFLNNAQTTDGTKALLKLDWNINQNHKLSVRHSYVRGETNIFPRPNNLNVIFNNVGYIFPSTTNSFAAELKSNFGNKASNNLILGVTSVRDDRDILGDPFPQIILQDGPATITLGTDNFSYSNIVFQDVYTLTNNFNFYKGKHTFTVGTHNEFFSIQNLFTIFSTPRYEYFFNGLERFTTGQFGDLSLFGHESPAEGQNGIRLGDEAENLGPTFNAMQLAFYVQDEIQFNPKFKLTAGLRFDVPIFLEDPPLENTDFNQNTVPAVEQFYDLGGARASNTPNTQVLVSPRLGFNWDVSGDQTTQLRGGVGIFTSRVPWVWPGGMYIRNGLNSKFAVNFGIGQQEVLGDPQQWLDSLAINSSDPGGDVDLFVDDFKYPQIFRGSIAVDQQLPWGMVGTAEFMYTKTLNNIDVKNVNLRPSTENLEGPDNRPIYNFDGNLIDPTYTNITLVDNTNKGFTWNATVQLQKPFDNGFTASLAYSFTRAEALFDGTGFINNTNWDNIISPIGKNSPILNRSVYDVGSRITGFLSYRKEYLNASATTIALFYNGQSGQPFTYTYLDNDGLTDQTSGSTNNIPIYVPANRSEINLISYEVGDNVITPEQQWADLEAFIASDDYLSGRRGEYAQANRQRTPFENVFDLKIMQDFYVMSGNTKHNLQLSLDIFNFTNFLNKDWGRRYFVPGNTLPLINFEGFVPGTNTPQFTYRRGDDQAPWDVVQSGIYSARWSAQLGIRYSF